MRVKPDVYVRPNRLADGREALGGPRDDGYPRQLVAVGRMGRHLQGGVTVLVYKLAGMGGDGLRRGAAATLVDADAVAALAAEQPVHRHPGRLARDVPERVLDPADGRVDDRAARKARVRVEVVPDTVDIAGIASGDPTLEVADGRRDRLVRPDRIGFTQADQSLIGVDPHDERIPPGQWRGVGLDLRDLHGLTPSVLTPALSTMWRWNCYRHWTQPPAPSL